jgi:hypothetical protein
MPKSRLKGKTDGNSDVGVAVEKLLRRVWWPIASGIWAHLPIIVVVGMFLLASKVLLNNEDHQFTFDVVAVAGKISILFLLFIVSGMALGLIWLIVTPSPDRSVASIAGKVFRRNWFEIVLLRMPVAFGLVYMIGSVHLGFKVNIPNFAPYSWDHFFAEIDRAMFLGQDPWVLSHAVFSGVSATLIIDTLYRIWFLVLQFCIFSIVALQCRSRLRLTFLLAYSLNWIIGGAFLAIMMPAAGPVYMERIYGDPTFQPLMDLLHDQARFATLTALDLQEWLWDGLTNPDVPPYGISAFPSLHVEMAATCACLGFSVNRVLGWTLAVFTGVILVGSVHLGWHYIIDGLFGILLAVLLWHISARVTEWWLMRTEPRGARNTAVA